MCMNECVGKLPPEDRKPGKEINGCFVISLIMAVCAAAVGLILIL